MLRGLPASIVLHAAIVGIGYVSWPLMAASNRSGESDRVIVPIELVDIGAVTNISAVRRPLPEPELELAPPEPEPAPPEDELPEPEPDPVDESLLEDDFDTARASKSASEAEPEEVVPELDKTPEKPVPPKKTESKKTEPLKPVVKPDNPLDEFLKTADSTFESERQTRKKQPDTPPQTQPPLNNNPIKPQLPRKGAGEQTANTARLEAILYSRIVVCWDGVDDQPNPEKLNVSMALRLDKNGNIEDLRLLSPTRRPVGTSPMGVAVDRALRAVRKCAPYNLPEEDYASWREINVNLGLAFAQPGD